MNAKKAIYKLKHWRGVWDENGLDGAPNVEFDVVVLGKGRRPLRIVR